jgi:uncharacterized protein (DUF1330 family)
MERTMTTYMIFIREGQVFDAAEMDLYQKSTRAGAPDPKLKPLIVYGKMETFEGEAPDGVVLLEFPDTEAAKAWYFSDRYQAAAAHRMRGANYRVLMVEGV